MRKLLGGLGRSSRSGSGVSRSSLSRSSGIGRSGFGRSLSSRSLGSRSSFGRSLSRLATASGQSERSEKGAKSELRLHFAITPKSKVKGKSNNLASLSGDVIRARIL